MARPPGSRTVWPRDRNQRITPGGNPQTGPFYVEGAQPGDTLVVHFDKMWPNRGQGYTAPIVAPPFRRGVNRRGRERRSDRERILTWRWRFTVSRKERSTDRERGDAWY